MTESKTKEVNIQFKYKNEIDDATSRLKFQYYQMLSFVRFQEQRLQNPDEIVITDKKISIQFTYPLGSPVSFEFVSIQPEGFSRKELIKHIVETYKKIYQEEAETTTSRKDYPHLLNRGTTNGKYKIYGHELRDLVLERITYDSVAHQVDLGIGS